MTDVHHDVHTQLCELLDRRGAIYRVVEHEPEGHTELIAKIRGNRPDQAIKSIVVQIRMGKQDNLYCLANIPGDCRVDLKAIKALYNANSAAFATREKAGELTDCVIGAIPPFSFNDQLAVLADPLIRQNEEVVFNAGRLDRSIFMRSEDYFKIAAPRQANIALRS